MRHLDSPYSRSMHYVTLILVRFVTFAGLLQLQEGFTWLLDCTAQGAAQMHWSSLASVFLALAHAHIGRLQCTWFHAAVNLACLRLMMHERPLGQFPQESTPCFGQACQGLWGIAVACKSTQPLLVLAACTMYCSSCRTHGLCHMLYARSVCLTLPP